METSYKLKENKECEETMDMKALCKQQWAL